MDNIINEYMANENINSTEETNSEISEISDISDIEDIKEIFEIKIHNNFDSESSSSDTESSSGTESSRRSNSECSIDYSYDTFDTSDSNILKKQKIKMELLLDKKLLKTDSKNEFHILFKKLLNEFKKKHLRQIKVEGDESDESSEYYLHGYKFF